MLRTCISPTPYCEDRYIYFAYVLQFYCFQRAFFYILFYNYPVLAAVPPESPIGDQ